MCSFWSKTLMMKHILANFIDTCFFFFLPHKKFCMYSTYRANSIPISLSLSWHTMQLKNKSACQRFLEWGVTARDEGLLSMPSYKMLSVCKETGFLPQRDDRVMSKDFGHFLMHWGVDPSLPIRHIGSLRLLSMFLFPAEKKKKKNICAKGVEFLLLLAGFY